MDISRFCRRNGCCWGVGSFRGGVAWKVPSARPGVDPNTNRHGRVRSYNNVYKYARYKCFLHKNKKDVDICAKRKYNECIGNGHPGIPGGFGMTFAVTQVVWSKRLRNRSFVSGQHLPWIGRTRVGKERFGWSGLVLSERQGMQARSW